MGRTGIGVLWLFMCCSNTTSQSELVNVARGKTYSQSSYYDDANKYPSSHAANGNTGGTYNSNNCISTIDTGGATDFSPWWQVDLGRKYPVYNITAWARAGYVDLLYPVNITVDGRQCVRATSTGSRERSLSCTSPITGRVVRLTRDYRKTGTGSLARPVPLIVCEVQIWLCDTGYYLSGSACDPCSNNCVNQLCDSVSGRCTRGCNAGWYGERCDSYCSALTPRCTQCAQDGGQCSVCSGHFKPSQCTECDSGYYKSGTICIACNSNCVNKQCDSESGLCTNGCYMGWYGDRCNISCSSLTSRCTQCDQDGGKCTACSGHFQPSPCTVCNTGYYLSGSTCVPCSNTCVNQLCDSASGKCNSCDSGYYKSGISCVDCNSNCVNKQCTAESGRCTDGCNTGWYRDRCDSKCSDRTSRCTQCVRDNGQCTACSGHFKPSQCTGCDSGYYKSGTFCVACNSNCVNKTCNAENGRCTDGCNTGWYGDRCDSNCSDRTSRCTQCARNDGQCTACSGHFKPPLCSGCDSGYYKSGTFCVACNSNCVNKQCNAENGRCTDGCNTGWYGDRCDSNCSDRTSRCTQCARNDGQCTACSGHFKPPLCSGCDSGYYKSGTSCVACNSNCVNKTCNAGSGRCTDGCNVGWYGKRCDFKCSTLTSLCTQCARNDGQCTTCSGHFKPSQCTVCSTGYYLSGSTCVSCSSTCVNQLCDSVSGKCNSCDSGYYKSGTTCVACNSNCVNMQCNAESGRCTNGCKAGWYRDRCDSRCSTGCSQCVQDGGRCTVCSTTYYLSGSACKRCSNTCVNQLCYSDNGRCNNCVSGKYKSCTSCIACNSNCVNKKCDSDSGRCKEGCDPGWYADRCDSSCSKLTPRCTQCVQDGGRCTTCSGHFQPPNCTDCVDGFYMTGTSCTNCTWKCDKDALCNKTTGHCAECPPGKKGDRCDRDCDNNHYGPSRCSLPCGQCKGSVQCDPVTGHCQQCEPGWYLPLCKELCTDNTYGINCSQTCGRCKGGQACDPQTGNCTEGCEPGFNSSDVLCKTKCDNGTYGENCTLACGHCQGDVVCHHETGNCGPGGCKPGFSGAQCLSAIPPDEKSSSAVVAAVVSVLLIIIIVAVVVIVLFVVFRRRRKRASNSNGTSRDTTNLSMDDFNEVNSNDGDSSGGAIYQNVPGPATKNTSKSADRGRPSALKTSAQPRNGEPSSGADGKKRKPRTAAKPDRSAANIYENVAGPGFLSAELRSTAPKTSAQPSNTRPNTGGQKEKKPPVAARPAKKKAAHTSRENLPEPENFEVEEPVYGNDPKFFKTPSSLVLSELQKCVNDKLRGTTLEQEFEQMDPVKASMNNGQRQENYYKNRFNNILPYDKNRIQLDQVDGDDASDFINASFIKGFKQEKGYIASQGPKTNIHDDFWRMVWQEKVSDIVMLTNLKEGIKNKCSEYWPAERATMKTRHMVVTGVGDVETRSHFILRTFDIRHKEGKEKRRVKQYHYISWMDHEVPAITPLINFWRYVRIHAPRLPSAPPLLVHCSAGVGRTGTFIALDIAIAESEQASEVNLFNVVDRLRDDRCFMVQNKDQYAFLHEAFLEAYTSRDTRIEVAAMGTVLPASFDRNTPNTKIDAEYEMLNKMRNWPTQPSYTMANMPENGGKNRNPNVLPDDNHLVYITQHVRGRNQYINGVSVPTFLNHRGSILTQLPLPDTLVDLWRLVDGSGVKLIVSIGDIEEQQDMCCYWPKEGAKTLETGPYAIRMTSSSKMGSFLWSYTLTLDKDGSTKEVHVLHYTSWKGKCADDTAELILLLTTMQEVEKETGGDPVIIQCIDGSLKSGVLCALWDVVSRMTHDEELDVYLAARMVTMARPEAFVSVEQYRFCYEVAQQIKNLYNVYSNT